MTLDPRCEPLLDELMEFVNLIHDNYDCLYISENSRRKLLEIIDKHLCPCGHAYRKRSS